MFANDAYLAVAYERREITGMGCGGTATVHLSIVWYEKRANWLPGAQIVRAQSSERWGQ